MRAKASPAGPSKGQTHALFKTSGVGQFLTKPPTSLSLASAKTTPAAVAAALWSDLPLSLPSLLLLSSFKAAESLLPVFIVCVCFGDDGVIAAVEAKQRCACDAIYPSNLI